MHELDAYLAARQAVWDYFGYVEDWPAIPLDDRREYYWRMDDTRTVYYASDKAIAESREGDNTDGYEDAILRHRHLPKAVYAGDAFTMIVTDPRTDGNLFLAVFDNAKRVGQ